MGIYSVVLEEMMVYIDDSENVNIVQRSAGRVQTRTLSPITKDCKLKNPRCIICSVEESVKIKL